MSNTTDPFAQSIHGTNPQYLIEKITRTKIYQTTYWKEQCFGLTSQSIIDKAISLKYIGGNYGGNVKPTNFLCLVCKLLQLQPELDIILEYIKQSDFKYLRVLGAFYLRLTNKSELVYKYLEPLLIDYRKVSYRGMGGWNITHIDEFVDQLLHDEIVCDIALPYLIKRIKLEQLGTLEQRKSVLDMELFDDDDDEEDDDDSVKDPLLNQQSHAVQECDIIKNDIDMHIHANTTIELIRSYSSSKTIEQKENRSNAEKPLENSSSDHRQDITKKDLREQTHHEHSQDYRCSRHDRSRDRDRSSRHDRSRDRDRSSRHHRSRDRDDDSRDHRMKDRKHRRSRSSSRDDDDEDSYDRRRTKKYRSSTRYRSRSPSSSDRDQMRDRDRRYSRRSPSRSDSRDRHHSHNVHRSTYRNRSPSRDRHRYKTNRSYSRSNSKDYHYSRKSNVKQQSYNNSKDNIADKSKNEVNNTQNIEYKDNKIKESDVDEIKLVEQNKEIHEKTKKNEKKFDKIFGKKQTNSSSSTTTKSNTTDINISNQNNTNISGTNKSGGGGKEVINSKGEKVFITASEGSIEYWNQMREALGMKKLK